MLGVDVADYLPGFRAEAESLMADTVLVERATGTVTMDPVTLVEVPEFEDVYMGAARVQRPGVQPAQAVVGEIEFGLLTVLVQLPLSVTGPRRDDRVTVTAVGSVSDVGLLGLVATVQADLRKSHPTKRTLVCAEVT